MTYMVCKIKEESLKCLYCEHSSIMKLPLKSHDHPRSGFEKTIPKVNQTQPYSSLKKNLKNIQQRYQALNQ
jgi:hypothetical protein